MACTFQFDKTTGREFESGTVAVFYKENVGWMIWALDSLDDDPGNATPPSRNPGEFDDDYHARVKGMRPSEFMFLQRHLGACRQDRVDGISVSPQETKPRSILDWQVRRQR